MIKTIFYNLYKFATTKNVLKTRLFGQFYGPRGVLTFKIKIEIDMIKVGLVFSISNFSINKIA